MKSRTFAFLYSLLLPGAGQLYLGDRATGWTLLSMSAGVLIGLCSGPTLLSVVLLNGIYAAIALPAAIDAWQTGSGKPRTFKGENAFYVIVMLFVVGPFAVPLLWRSSKFSRAAKILWTVIVVFVALAAIVLVKWTASILDPLLF